MTTAQKRPQKLLGLKEVGLRTVPARWTGLNGWDGSSKSMNKWLHAGHIAAMWLICGVPHIKYWKCNKRWIRGEIVCSVVRFCGLGFLMDAR